MKTTSEAAAVSKGTRAASNAIEAADSANFYGPASAANIIDATARDLRNIELGMGLASCKLDHTHDTIIKVKTLILL